MNVRCFFNKTYKLHSKYNIIDQLLYDVSKTLSFSKLPILVVPKKYKYLTSTLSILK